MLIAFAAADKPKIEQIYQTQMKALWKYAYSILRNDAEAQDVVQQSALEFMEIYHKIETLEISRLRGYLFIILRNNVYDACKSRKRMIPTEDVFLELQGKENAEEIALGNLTARQIRACIGELPPKYAAYIQLTYLEELDKPIIAKMLKVKPDSLRMIDVRAKRYLKDLCEKRLVVK